MEQTQTIFFDTHDFVKSMTEAGMEPPVAEALAAQQAKIHLHNLSTKEDIARLELKLADVKNEILKWLIGMVAAQTTIIIAVIKLF